MENNNKTTSQAWLRSFLVICTLGLMAVANIDMIFETFVFFGEVSFFLPYIIMIVGIAFGLTLLARIYHRYMQENELSLKIQDLITSFKFSLITLAITAGSSISMVTGLLWFEKLDNFNGFSNESASWGIQTFETVSLFMLVLLVTGPGLEVLAYECALLIYPLIQGVPALMPLLSLPYWLGFLGICVVGTYVSGGDFSDIWYISPDAKNDRESGVFAYSSRNFGWMLLVFLIGAPTIFLTFFYWGALGLTVAEYGLLVLSSVCLYAIQPFVEEVIFRSFLFKYLGSEGLARKDYRQMTTGERVVYALFNAWLFVMAHQAVRGYTSLVEILIFIPGSMLMAYLPFLTGRIDLSTFEHGFHNLSCSIAAGFCLSWAFFAELLESIWAVIIPGATAATVKLGGLLGIRAVYNKCYGQERVNVDLNQGSPLLFTGGASKQEIKQPYKIDLGSGGGILKLV